MAIGERICERRKALGLTQQELAELMGYKSKSSIAKIETGVNGVSHAAAIQFARVLKTDIDQLMEWDTAEENMARAGVTAEDIACETGLDPAAVAAILDGRLEAGNAELLAVANMLSAQDGRIRAELTAREYALILRYRAAVDKDRAIVEAALS